MLDRGSVVSPSPSILTPSPFSPYIPHPVNLDWPTNCKTCKNSSSKYCSNRYQDGTTQSWARCRKTRAATKGQVSQQWKTETFTWPNNQAWPPVLPSLYRAPALLGLESYVSYLTCTRWIKPLTSATVPWVILFRQLMGVPMSGTGHASVYKTYSTWGIQTSMNKYNAEIRT